MIIRNVSQKEINSIYKIGLKEFSGEYWLTKEFIKETIKEKGIYLGAFEKGQIIGVIFVKIFDKPKAWIYFFVIDKKYRQIGIGRKLLKTAENKLPKGYFLLLVDLENKDISAKKFYKKNKFKKVGSIKDWFGKNTTGLLYVKRLKK